MYVILALLSVFTFYSMNFTGRQIQAYQPLTLTTADDANPSFNLLFRTLAPNVFIIFYSIAFHITGQKDLIPNLWLIVPLQVLFRILYNIHRLSIFNWSRFIASSTISISIAYTLDKYVLSDTSILFPDIRSLGNELWLVIILYCYTVANTLLSNNLAITSKRSDDFIKTSYSRIKTKWGDLISSYSLDPGIELFVYALIISENFNRPLGIRITEKILSPFKSMGTYGVMQVKSEKYLNDEESLNIGINNVKNLYDKILESSKAYSPHAFDNTNDYGYDRVFNRIAWFHNRSSDYADEVIRVKHKLKEIINPSHLQRILVTISFE